MKLAVVLTIPAALLGYIGSDFFGFDFIPSASLLYLGLNATAGVFNFLYGENTNPPQEERQSATESDDCELEDEEQNLQNDLGETGVLQETESSSGSELTERSTSPSNNYGLTKLETDVLESESNRLNGWFWIHEDGGIEFIRNEDLNVYTEMMLYTIAAKFASEEGSRDSPIVSGKELNRELGSKKSEVWAYLNKTEGFLVPTPQVKHTDFNNVYQIDFEIDTKQLSRAVDWVLDNNEMFREPWDLDFNYAFLDISKAEEHYEEYTTSDESSRRNRYRTPDRLNGIKCEITEALNGVCYYPVKFSYDGDWMGFTNAVDAAIMYMEDNRDDKIPHCLKRMRQYLRGMKATSSASSQDW